jgi:hypothetical protein
MPKHNLHTVKPTEEPVEKPVEKPIEKIFVEPDVPTTAPMRLRIDANYKITGKFSGREYLFRGAGSVQDVDKRDEEWLLSLRRGKGCCGGGGDNAILELAGE